MYAASKTKFDRVSFFVVACIHCVLFVYIFYYIPVLSETLPNGLDFRHLAFSAYRTIFNPFPCSVHQFQLLCGNGTNVHTIRNGCKQTKVNRKMIEYIIRTNRIKHSYQIQKVPMKQKKKAERCRERERERDLARVKLNGQFVE